MHYKANKRKEAKSVKKVRLPDWHELQQKEILRQINTWLTVKKADNKEGK